jgi:hypothetical protein
VRRALSLCAPNSIHLLILKMLTELALVSFPPHWMSLLIHRFLITVFLFPFFLILLILVYLFLMPLFLIPR